MSQSKKVSVNKGAFAIVQQLVAEADRYRVIVSKGSRGETLIDCRELSCSRIHIGAGEIGERGNNVRGQAKLWRNAAQVNDRCSDR